MPHTSIDHNLFNDSNSSQLIKFSRNEQKEIVCENGDESTVLTEKDEIQNSGEGFDLIFKNNHSISSEHYKKFNVVCLGGTFDRLHLGHKILLTQALLLFNQQSTSEKHEIQIGVSVDGLLKNKKLKELIQSYELRRDNVLKSISKIDPSLDMSRVNIFPLPEPWGPIATDPKLEVLVVSEETLNGAKKGNEIRKTEKNFPTYDIVCIPLLLPRVISSTTETQDSIKLSSSQLREMEFNTSLIK